MIKVLEGQLNADISDPRIVIRPDVRCPQGIIMEIDVLRYFLMCGKKGKIIVRLCLEDAERMFGRAALGAAHPDRGQSCLSCSGLFERRGETELRSV